MNNVVYIKLVEVEIFQTYLFIYIMLCQIPATFENENPVDKNENICRFGQQN